MSLYRHVLRCNAHNLDLFIPFIISGKHLGWIRNTFADHLHRWPKIFDLSEGKLLMNDNYSSCETRTKAVKEVCEMLADENAVPPSRGELFSVAPSLGDAPLLNIDRAWISVFGFESYGVHVNGYVTTPAGPELWLGIRSPDCLIDPEKLDNMVAGGLPAGHTLEENLLKEASEEASIDKDLALKAHSAGYIGYIMEVKEGLRRDTLFVYDLAVPEDFEPVDRDGEHINFIKVPASKALSLVEDGDEFKFNVNLVIIDFSIRHGILKPDHHEYKLLNRGLRPFTKVEDFLIQKS